MTQQQIVNPHRESCMTMDTTIKFSSVKGYHSHNLHTNHKLMAPQMYTTQMEMAVHKLMGMHTAQLTQLMKCYPHTESSKIADCDKLMINITFKY